MRPVAKDEIEIEIEVRVGTREAVRNLGRGAARSLNVAQARLARQCLSSARTRAEGGRQIAPAYRARTVDASTKKSAAIDALDLRAELLCPEPALAPTGASVTVETVSLTVSVTTCCVTTVESRCWRTMVTRR